MIVQDQLRASVPVAVNPVPAGHELAGGPGVFEQVAEAFLASRKRKSIFPRTLSSTASCKRADPQSVYHFLFQLLTLGGDDLVKDRVQPARDLPVGIIFLEFP